MASGTGKKCHKIEYQHFLQVFYIPVERHCKYRTEYVVHYDPFSFSGNLDGKRQIRVSNLRLSRVISHDVNKRFRSECTHVSQRSHGLSRNAKATVDFRSWSGNRFARTRSRGRDRKTYRSRKRKRKEAASLGVAFRFPFLQLRGSLHGRQRVRRWRR